MLKPHLTDEAPYFNSSALSEYEDLETESGEPLAKGLLKDYVNNSEKIVKSLNQNLEIRNFKELERLYHSLKSSSALVGAVRVQAVSIDLEKLSIEKNLNEISTLNIKFLEILKISIAEIQAHLNSGAD